MSPKKYATTRRRRRKSGPNPIAVILIIAAIAVVSGWCYERCTSPASANASAQPTSTDSLMTVILPEGTPQQIVDYPGFTVNFNKEHHQPNYVVWELTGDETDGPVPRSNKFRPDDNVEGCASLDDYRNSGFDRGHMAPAQDMKWSEESMYACFYLTNMCPQKSVLNSGSWKTLEEHTRTWADRDSALIVICGPVLADRLTQTIGDSKVTVPTRFFKVILAPHANPPRAIAFVMNNGKVEGGMQRAVTSVDEVERITGYDFFSALPDEIENEIESQNRLSAWESY